MLFYNTLLSLLCATSAAATTLARGVEKRDTPKVLSMSARPLDSSIDLQT